MPTSRFPDWESFEFPAAAQNADAAGTDAGTDVGAAAAGDGAAPVAEDAPVAFCADLSPASVLGAYGRGIIPLPVSDEYFRTLNEFRYEDQVAAGTIALVGDEAADPYWVAWWSPDPRPVIDVGRVHLGRNTRKWLRRSEVRTTANARFGEVLQECRVGREPRWLTETLVRTLLELHAEGWAHSIEVWLDGDLIGGAMGIGVGRVISGDSLFGRYPGAAGVAVADMAARLGEAGGVAIDAQWDSPFLRGLGAEPVPRERYLALLERSGSGSGSGSGSAGRIVLPGGLLEGRRLIAVNATGPETGLQ